jgi:hypothetical protein
MERRGPFSSCSKERDQEAAATGGAVLLRKDRHAAMQVFGGRQRYCLHTSIKRADLNRE